MKKRNRSLRTVRERENPKMILIKTNRSEHYIGKIVRKFQYIGKRDYVQNW